METPQNAWDRANYIAHSLSPKQQLGEIIFDTNGQRLAFFGIEFHCDTEARSFCTRNDDGSHNLVDYVLLTHNLRFMPQISTTWRGWDRYRFFVRALDEEASTSLHQGSAIPASDLGNWFYKEKGPGTLQAASVLQSSPPTSNIAQSFSTSVGSNMGFNAGFFGPEPTATYSEGQDMSKSFQYSTGSVSVQDYSNETTIYKQFTINHLDMDLTISNDFNAKNYTDPGFTTYEVTVAELFKIPDDGLGDRDKKEPTVFRCFEVALEAERDLKTDSWTSHANKDMENLTTNVRQIIRVKAPPLPWPGPST